MAQNKIQNIFSQPQYHSGERPRGGSGAHGGGARRGNRQAHAGGRTGGGHQGQYVTFTSDQVKVVIENCWRAVCVDGANEADFHSVKTGVSRAFRDLSPVTPAPREDWYKTVFSNFDTDHDGFLGFTAFEEIVQQYYDHHAEKMKVRQVGAAPRQTSPRPPISSAPAGDKPPALIAKLKPSEPQPRTQDGQQVEGVTLASYIMCPAHKGAHRKIVADYEFLDTSKLGKGTYGTVQVVQHRRTKERRACKKIPVTHNQQWHLIETEIQLMKSLNHPNILRLHETYHDGQMIYLLMELCEGGQLFDRIVYHYERRRSPITEEQVSEWMRQILSATAYCHAKGIVHRDIKPENILFVNSSEKSPVKVIDFGLSSTMDVIRQNQQQITERKTGVGAFVAKVLPKINGKTIVHPNVKRVKMQRAGTPHYMAPEMIKGEYDEKCDIFSAGVIMYQLLSGTHPFYRSGIDNVESTKNKILNDNPPTTGDAWTYVSSEAKKLLRWMLEKLPSKRCSASEALSHSWFKTMEKPKSGLGSQLMGSVFDGLKNWQNQNRLKQAVLQLLAKQLSEGDITELRKKFMYFDSRGDGTITVDELRNSMSQAGHSIPESEMQNICDSLDAGGDGRIGYNEFISALLARRWNFQESQLREAFNQFDVRGEGHITNKDLQIALKGTRYGQLTDSQVEEILKEIDQNDDGMVDFDEFVTLMTN